MLRRAAARAAARAAELATAQRHCVQLAPVAEAAPVRAGGGAGPNAPPRARGFGAAAPPGSTLPLSFYDSAVEKAAMSASTEYSIKQMLEFGTGVAGPDGIRYAQQPVQERAGDNPSPPLLPRCAARAQAATLSAQGNDCFCVSRLTSTLPPVSPAVCAARPCVWSTAPRLVLCCDLRQRRPPNTLGEGWSPFKTLQFGRYVHRELPIRLARRLMDLHQMPYVVVTNPNIMGVYRYYLESFQALKAFPELKTIEDNYGA